MFHPFVGLQDLKQKQVSACNNSTPILRFKVSTTTLCVHVLTVVSWVSTHERLNVTPTWAIYLAYILYGSCYIGPFETWYTCTWALAQDTTVFAKKGASRGTRGTSLITIN